MTQGDARRYVGKWLNESPNSIIDPRALAELCADYDRLLAEQEKTLTEFVGWLAGIPEMRRRTVTSLLESADSFLKARTTTDPLYIPAREPRVTPPIDVEGEMAALREANNRLYRLTKKYGLTAEPESSVKACPACQGFGVLPEDDSPPRYELSEEEHSVMDRALRKSSTHVASGKLKVSVEQERIRFEAWATERSLNLDWSSYEHVGSERGYQSFATDVAWDAWLEALNGR